MPEAEAKPAAAPATPAPAKPPSPIVLVAVVAVALVAGAGLGALVLAPRFTPSAAAKTSSPDAKAAGHEAKKEGGHGKSGGHGKEGESKKFVHRIENLIVNPAGSEGTRFLMTTIAVECPDQRTAELMRDRDVELRDIVIATLEVNSLAALTGPGARDRLKRSIEAAIKPVAPQAAWVRVYLPQFVIQ